MSITSTKRIPGYPVADEIINRWSPRAFIPEPITNEQLFSLFEAARWAPSCYNNQPWRFIYAKRDTSTWPLFLDLLVPFNKEWAQNASVLIIIASTTQFTYNNKPSRTHAFDTGAAWENLALQASMNGLAAHGMEGFDYQKAATLINLPTHHEIHAMCAVGKPGDPNNLSPELQAKETISDRNPITAFTFEGTF